MDKKKQIQISNAFRQSAAGVKLGRVLFDPGLQGNISPTQIASLLRQAGVPIPQEVSIGLQAAQLIMSGGTLISQVSSFINGASSIMQISQSTTNYVAALMSFFRTIGLLEDSVAMRTVQMGADAVLVISSAGSNVYADIALVMDIIQAIAFPPDERPMVAQALDKINQRDARRWIADRTSTQINAGQELIKNYQDKKISMFEFIGEFAIQAGDAFPNYFPEYGVFLPPRVLTKSFVQEQWAAHGGFLFIMRQDELIRRTLNVNLTTTSAYNQRDLVRAFVSKFITDTFAPYFVLNKMGGAPGLGSIDFTSLACLSVLSDDFDYMSPDFDIVPTLQKLLLMPDELSFNDFLFSEMGYVNNADFVDRGLKENVAYAQSGISLNGLALDSKAAARNKQITLDNYSRKLAMKAEAEGDILRLTKIPLVRDIIQKWGRVPNLTPSQIAALPGNTYRKTNASDQTDYRNIQNYFSAISVIDAMSRDNWLNKNDSFSDITKGINWVLPLRDKMEAYFDRMFNLSMARFINIKSRQNVADFYGTTLDKIEFKNNPDGTAFIVPKGTK